MDWNRNRKRRPSSRLWLCLGLGICCTATLAHCPTGSKRTPPTVVSLPARPTEVVASRPEPKGWAEFESEFGIAHPSQSRLLNTIQTAKYRLDEASYTADRFLHRLGHALEFELGRGGLKHADNPRLKFDVALNEGGPYLGVRFIIPLGN